MLSAAPVAVSLAGAVFAGMTNGLGAANTTEVVASASAGPLPAEVTSGLFMHMFLAAAVWYMVAAECGFRRCGFSSCVCCDDASGEGLMTKNSLKSLRVAPLIKLYIIME